MSWKVLSIILYGHTLPNSILLTTEYLTALIARTDYMFCAGFFCTRKNFFIFFQNHATNHTLLYRYGAERGINTFHVITERGCDDMKPSDFQKTIQCQFDCKLKRVVKGIVRNYRKELKRRRTKEISYCELPERKRNTLLMYYFLEMTESEIANLQKITQSGVFRNRHHALETMKKILKEEH